MFATLARPEAVAEWKRQGYRVDYGDWIKEAGNRLAAAAKNGELQSMFSAIPRRTSAWQKLKNDFTPMAG